MTSNLHNNALTHTFTDFEFIRSLTRTHAHIHTHTHTHTVPTFGNFIQAATNSTSVSAEWTLISNGIRPLLQMVVRWRDGLESEDPNQFPPESNVIFDFVEDIQQDGVRLSHEFKGLKPATRYAVLVEARNYVGISRTSFAMETGESLD